MLGSEAPFVSSFNSWSAQVQPHRSPCPLDLCISVLKRLCTKHRTDSVSSRSNANSPPDPTPPRAGSLAVRTATRCQRRSFAAFSQGCSFGSQYRTQLSRSCCARRHRQQATGRKRRSSRLHPHRSAARPILSRRTLASRIAAAPWQTRRSRRVGQERR